MSQGFYGFPRLLDIVRATSFKAIGKAGATNGAALAGGTASGAPTAPAGPFDVGDMIPDATGKLWICTVAGTSQSSPGTFVQVGGSSVLTTKGDLWGYGSADARVPIGSDGTVLVADSTQTLGLGWQSGYAAGTPAPAVRCYNSSNISINSATLVALTFDTNRLDAGTATAQHSTSSQTSRLVCRQGGVYQISGGVQFAANTTGQRAAQIKLNGTTVIAGHEVQATSAENVTLTLSTLYSLAAGDYVELIAYQTSGGALNVTASANQSPEFMMARTDAAGSPTTFGALATKTANYTLGSSDAVIVAGANSLTLTLPTAGGAGAGRLYVIKNGNFTSTTVARSGSDTIDGATSYSLASAYSSAEFVSDGASAWLVF